MLPVLFTSSMFRWLLRQIMPGKCSFDALVLLLTKTEKRREGDGANTWGLKILLAKTG